MGGRKTNDFKGLAAVLCSSGLFEHTIAKNEEYEQ
mgnify:CR=1 FL=1